MTRRIFVTGGAGYSDPPSLVADPTLARERLGFSVCLSAASFGLGMDVDQRAAPFLDERCWHKMAVLEGATQSGT